MPRAARTASGSRPRPARRAPPSETGAPPRGCARSLCRCQRAAWHRPLRVEHASKVDAAGALALVGNDRLVIGHALDAEPAGATEPVERERGAAKETRAEVGEVSVHRHAGVLPQEGPRLDVDALSGRQHLGKDVAVAMQHQQARTALIDEAVDEEAGAAEEDVGHASDAEEVVGHAVRRQQELVLAHMDLFARLQLQGHDLARRVPRERDVAGAGRLRHEDLQAGEHALDGARERLEADAHLRLLPQQHVVLEVDALAAAELDVDDRDQLPLDAHGHVARAQEALGLTLLRHRLIGATGAILTVRASWVGRSRAVRHPGGYRGLHARAAIATELRVRAQRRPTLWTVHRILLSR